MANPGPTVVLVHGAWHDERCWADVRAQLAVRDVRSASITLPSTDPGRELPGFADDVAAVVELVDATSGDVTLCGHGYGGMVISEAGNHERVRRLVYLAAFCPQPGQRVVDQALGGLLSRRALRLTGDGRMILQTRVAARRLYGDLPTTSATALASKLLPSTAAIHRAQSNNPAWLTRPTTYVSCGRDRVLDRERSSRTAQRVVRTHLARGCSDSHAVTLATGHCPFYSAPALVAEVVMGADPRLISG